MTSQQYEEYAPLEAKIDECIIGLHNRIDKHGRTRTIEYLLDKYSFIKGSLRDYEAENNIIKETNENI
jgi:hypothetical protein